MVVIRALAEADIPEAERIVRHLSGRFAITLRSGGDAPRERDTG